MKVNLSIVFHILTDEQKKIVDQEIKIHVCKLFTINKITNQKNSQCSNL